MINLVCLGCSGTGHRRVQWVNADLRERSRQVKCLKCNGSGRIQVVQREDAA